MLFKSLALVAGATIAAADSTVTLFLPGFDAPSIDAKIVGSSSAMTTYLLNCPPKIDTQSCYIPDGGYTYTAGSSKVIYALTMDSDSETILESCNLEGTTSATCWGTMIYGNVTSTESTAIDVATIPYGGFQAVHVTATETGRVAASTGASASAPTATVTNTSTGASTGTTSQSTNTATSAAAAASTTASHSTNAAGPVMTGNALWVAGGAAAALALVAV